MSGARASNHFIINMNLCLISAQHPLWPQWVELYQHSFPDFERIPITAIIDSIEQQDANHYALAFASDQYETTLRGLAYLVMHSEERVAYLVYLAVSRHMRNRGIGVLVYEALCQYAREAGCDSMFFEVEHPDDPHVDTEMATRRIRWYLRQGAEIITGIELWQRVSDQQPYIHYDIMAHRFTAVDDSETISTAMRLFPDIKQSSAPGLCSQWPPHDKAR